MKVAGPASVAGDRGRGAARWWWMRNEGHEAESVQISSGCVRRPRPPERYGVLNGRKSDEGGTFHHPSEENGVA